MVEAGKLNKKITVQKKTLGTPSSGYAAETWTDHSTRYAEMITTGGREFYAAQKVNEETTALFRMRYTAAINTAMRIKLGSRIFEILPPLNDVNGRHEELLVSTKEVT